MKEISYEDIWNLVEKTIKDARERGSLRSIKTISLRFQAAVPGGGNIVIGVIPEKSDFEPKGGA